ncbi:nucleoside 2-deoxyribosyltransferase [Hyphomicrobium sp. CS1GBMeth3]|uniref:nucleoside 2-deoxyribosyltransferase n=1 Tax=Hyphomicrobium sp. CS1GBMeth3 TaxID=1892845 RepID=UPI0009F89479|nr:nucleoside 2-deoxyribosyltransferase [Hyphomicrobium sp. CS1GBMeth3]
MAASLSSDAARLRVYLAGPDVFLPHAREQGEAKKQLAAEHGFEGLYPLDNTIETDGLSPVEIARAISTGNEGLMRAADFVIANCTPFRGPSMDAGTAYEIGFMQALGKPIFGYANVTADYAGRVRATPEHAQAHWDSETRRSDIEDFGLAENLMIAIAVLDSSGHFVVREVHPEQVLSDLEGFRACLALAQQRFAV